MGIEQRRCRLLLRRRRRPSISIYAFHILSARHSLLYPSLVNRYSTCVRKINTLQRLPKSACSHLLHPPSRLSTSEWRVNKFYMVEEPRLPPPPLSSSSFFIFLFLFPYAIAICTSTVHRNRSILQNDFLNKYHH